MSQLISWESWVTYKSRLRMMRAKDRPNPPGPLPSVGDFGRIFGGKGEFFRFVGYFYELLNRLYCFHPQWFRIEARYHRGPTPLPSGLDRIFLPREGAGGIGPDGPSKPHLMGIYRCQNYLFRYYLCQFVFILVFQVGKLSYFIKNRIFKYFNKGVKNHGK